MLDHQVRPVLVYEDPFTPYLQATDSRYNMVEPKSEYSLEELQTLADHASSQYLDLEVAENELQQWIRNANRGPHVLPASDAPPARSANGSITPAPTVDLPFHPNPQLQHPQPQPQPRHLLVMKQQSNSRYHYQDPTDLQPFFPPPPASPGPRSPGYQAYYQNHAQPFEPLNGSSSAYPYHSSYPSPSALSPSSSTDPELKRIRNTAASARFRAKKKRREQSLERNAKEKREALQKLEERIQELEAENKFLKGLIFDEEKMEGVKSELERIRVLKKEIEGEEGERDDGVGTL